MFSAEDLKRRSDIARRLRGGGGRRSWVRQHRSSTSDTHRLGHYQVAQTKQFCYESFLFVSKDSSGKKTASKNFGEFESKRILPMWPDLNTNWTELSAVLTLKRAGSSGGGSGTSSSNNHSTFRPSSSNQSDNKATPNLLKRKRESIVWSLKKFGSNPRFSKMIFQHERKWSQCWIHVLNNLW